MLEEAKNKIEELGYKDSLPRRFANISDISVNNVLFLDRDSAKEISEDIFEEMEKDIAVDPKKFGRCEEISIKDFIDNVLPTANSVDLLVENIHKGNFVSLIAPVNINAPSHALTLAEFDLKFFLFSIEPAYPLVSLATAIFTLGLTFISFLKSSP